MDRPLSHTVVFLFFALFSLIGLQAYFSYNDFEIKRLEFKQTINEAFQEAVTLEKEERKTIVLDSFRYVLLDTTRVKISAKFDSVDLKTIYSIQDAKSNEIFTSISFKDDQKRLNELTNKDLLITIERIVKATGDYLDDNAIYYWTNALGEDMIELTNTMIVDTSRLEQLYDSLLRKRQVFSNFDINLIPIDGKDSSIVNTDLQWQTSVLNTDLYSDQWDVYASFENPFQDIFRKALLSIGGSLFIILLTGLTFFLLLRTIVKQKRLAKIKADFLDNISHELQTPIATLKAANESMEKFGVLEDKQKAARYIKVQGQAIGQLSSMVDELLRNTIYNRAPKTFHLENIDYELIIRNIMASYELKSSKKIVFNFENQYHYTSIKTDQIAFESICNNLIGNAIKHHPKEELSIEISCRELNDAFQLEIADNGNGISPESAEKIFERFYQSDSRTIGHGLGLAYVKGLVEDLNGTIFVSDSASGGAKFIIQLPQAHG